MMRRMDTLLLIEDDHRLAQMVGEYLQQSGFAVHHAPTAEDGLLALTAHTPAMVLLDLMLPDADGLAWVEGKPKSLEGALREWRVGLRGTGSQTQVAVLEFTDGFGQTSRLELSAPSNGASPTASTFVFKPPPGYQVLRP